MALFSVPNIKITGIAACVPPRSESNLDYDWITEQERSLLIKTTGIENRRIADKGVTTSDLCLQAAEKLLSTLNWDRNEIQVIILVSQSHDYFLPASSIILQNKLGLPKSCIAFDIDLGCSGYVYGLSTIASIMTTAGLKKGLLLVGDISSFSLNRKDKSSYPLFGDAGTATALELDASADKMHFNLQSDGAGCDAIIIQDGGMRHPLTQESFEETEIEKGIIRSRRDLELNGLEIFNFSLREVAPNINDLLKFSQTDISNFDYFVFHQANKLMNETIRKKLKVDAAKVPYSLVDYGNTSSASIPLTIVSQLADKVKETSTRFLFSGFGTGFSWGSVILTTNHLVCPPVIDYK